MEKKILMALDDTIQSQNALNYAIGLFPLIQDLHFTLFHGQPHISQFLTDEAKTSFKAQKALDKLKKANSEKALELLEKHKARMIAAGIPENRLESKTIPRKLGLAKDIIDLAQEKRFDAILSGRRGLTRVQELFMGSLTAKLIEYSSVVPVWVVDGKVESSKILIAIDGSDSAFRAVDHASFICRKSAVTDITLFHVTPRLKDYCLMDFAVQDEELQEVILECDHKHMDCFMAKTLHKFNEAGISESQISVRQVKPRLTVGEAILDEIRNGNYGTVVIGRRGADKSFFMGNVSNYLLNKVSGTAIWLVS